jgi:hypothetical protein
MIFKLDLKKPLFNHNGGKTSCVCEYTVSMKQLYIPLGYIRKRLGIDFKYNVKEETLHWVIYSMASYNEGDTLIKGYGERLSLSKNRKRARQIFLRLLTIIQDYLRKSEAAVSYDLAKAMGKLAKSEEYHKKLLDEPTAL